MSDCNADPPMRDVKDRSSESTQVEGFEVDENRDSPERDMVNPSTDSYMWPIRDTH